MGNYCLGAGSRRGGARPSSISGTESPTPGREVQLGSPGAYHIGPVRGSLRAAGGHLHHQAPASLMRHGTAEPDRGRTRALCHVGNEGQVYTAFGSDAAEQSEAGRSRAAALRGPLLASVPDQHGGNAPEVAVLVAGDVSDRLIDNPGERVLRRVVLQRRQVLGEDIPIGTLQPVPVGELGLYCHERFLFRAMALP